MTRKINTTKVVALLAVLCMITSAFVGSTLAKYTTSNNGTDSARVAKWGVTVNADGYDVFAEEYANNSTTTVKSSTTDANVVAPGTEGSLTNVTISGTPEVATQVTYGADLTLSNWTDGYCPIIIKVDGEDYYIGKTNITDVASLETAVEEAITAHTRNYAVNATASDTLSVSWRWEFDGAESDATLSGYQTDEKDTKLGDAIVTALNTTETTDDITVALKVTTTVTQID